MLYHVRRPNDCNQRNRFRGPSAARRLLLLMVHHRGLRAAVEALPESSRESLVEEAPAFQKGQDRLSAGAGGHRS